jgi:biotin carboxyl carrier protein
LADELLPALVAKLGATGLGEIEVREHGWRVRLRRPGGAAGPSMTSAVARRRDRHDGIGERGSLHGHGASIGHAERTDRPPRLLLGFDGASARTAGRNVALAPAVGIYRPRTDLAAGMRVRAGDRLGAVDMLGIAQEVIAPVDGVMGASLAESGDAVEYGQELLVIEFAPVAPSSTGIGG